VFGALTVLISLQHCQLAFIPSLILLYSINPGQVIIIIKFEIFYSLRTFKKFFKVS